MQRSEAVLQSISNIAALVLAAGKGTRMHSPHPKVLQRLLGEPMLWYVYSALAPLFSQQVHTVVGFGADAVRKAFPHMESRFVLQEQQLGTGHALQTAWPAIKVTGAAYVLVVNGDTPLLPSDVLTAFMRNVLDSDVDVAFMSITPAGPNSFGRVVRGAYGRVKAIVEAKDFDPEVHGSDTGEVNAGIYLLRLAAIEPLLAKLTNTNKSGEYYITDLVDLAVASGLHVLAHECGDCAALMGINSPAELVAAEDALAARLTKDWLAQGVMLRNPAQVRIGPGVTLQPGCEIQGPCELYGTTTVAAGARVESHCVLRNAAVDQNAVIRNFSHLENAQVGPGCMVGPYARLRPGAKLETGSHVGNFVELKNAVLGEGAKANHLTYLGDAEVGAGSNIGAGTITCNYDGTHKHRTTIGKKAFVGSNTALVAPIALGDGVLVAAGSTLTQDVPQNSLAIARSRQTVKPRRSEGSS